ncbi:MAG: aminotransferase class I/II-fold pyridoxal phosphate-dependent enzyme [Candidatus Zixiibacteriota bacterium]
MRKRIIIDRADRLYQMPRATEDYYPQPSPLGGKKSEILDLGRPIWGPTAIGTDDSGVASAPISLEPASDGEMSALRQAIADWSSRELAVKLNPDREVLIGASVRDLLSLIGLAYLDPGDLALYPNPGYPAYRQTILTYGAEPVGYHLTHKREFKPRLKQFSERIGRAAHSLFINNPHNPSGADLEMEELDELLWLAARDNLMLINDAAYMAFSGCDDVSLMGSPSGKRIGIECYSLTYLAGGSRIPVGFAIGSKDLISGLKAAARIRGDRPLSHRAKRAVSVLEDYPSTQLLAMRARIRDTWTPAHELCEALGLKPVGRAGFPYLLARTPRRTSSQASAATILRRYGLVTLPAAAFGDLGEGYLRLALTSGPLLYREALERVKSRRLRAGEDAPDPGTPLESLWTRFE